MPDYTGNVIRATCIHLVARTPMASGWSSIWKVMRRVRRSEIDHLDGMLFVDRVVSRRTDLSSARSIRKAGQGLLIDSPVRAARRSAQLWWRPFEDRDQVP